MNARQERLPCALCGEEHVREEGPALYLIQTQEPVCLPCGQEHAPRLVALLDMGTAPDERTAGIDSPDAGSEVAE